MYLTLTMLIFDKFTEQSKNNQSQLFDNRTDAKRAIMNLNDFVSAVENLEREAMEDM